MSTLFDFSKKISDQELVTKQKIESLILPYQIVRITPFTYGNDVIKDFVIEFPHKTLKETLRPKDSSDNHFQFTITLWGGGSSGIKPSLLSNFATGGYSSGIILRFPVDIDPTNKFMVVHVGSGGSSFVMKDLKVINNGEYSSIRLLQCELHQGFKIKKYRAVHSSEGKTIELESLVSYGGGIDEDGNIIQSNSTNLFYSFDGSNPSNTDVENNDLEQPDHRNFYCPYLSVYDGYHSFLGIGGNHKTNLDVQSHSGAGGAGYLPNVSKEVNKDGSLKDPRVGKGGEGGMLLEYDNNKKVNIYVIGYYSVLVTQNKLLFLSGNTKFLITFEVKVYSVSELLNYIENQLPQDTQVSLTDNGKVKIKMNQPWSIDLGVSSWDLLSDLGFTAKDNPTWTTSTTEYQAIFSNVLYDVCPIDKF